jgi:hypothetical protein
MTTAQSAPQHAEPRRYCAVICRYRLNVEATVLFVPIQVEPNNHRLV